MDLHKEEALQPLQPPDPASVSDAMSDLEFASLSTKRTTKKSRLSLVGVLALSLFGSNCIWLWAYLHHEHGTGLESENQSYYNSSTVHSQPFHWNTGFSGQNKIVSDELWKGIFPHGAGLVSVPRTWAASQQLPFSKSPEKAEDDTHALYLVSVLHNLHCLTVLRSSLYHIREGEQQTKRWPHITHCLDSIRQSLMCNMDATLMYTEDGIVYGDGQVHQCRDWKALMNWVEKHDVDISLAHPPTT